MTKRQRDKAAAAAPTDFAESVIRHGGKPKAKPRAKPEPKYDIVYSELEGGSGKETIHDAAFCIVWGVKGIGFGTFEFYRKGKKLYCNNECMSKEFVKIIMSALVDSAIFTEK